MPLPPVCLLHGDDEFAIAERVAELKSLLGDPSAVSLNTAELDGRVASVADLRRVGDPMPFLAEQRLVIVNGLLTRLTARADPDDRVTPAKSASDSAEAFIQYFGNLPPTTSFVFVESKAVNEKSRLFKALSAVPNADVRRLDMPEGAGLAKWISQRAKAGGGQFAPEAAEALAAVGNDPRSLANEVEKLLAYVNWQRPVERDDVELLTTAAPDAVIWDLVDALGARNGQKALGKFHTLLAMPSQDQFAIFGMIVRQFRLILQTKEIVEGGGNVATVMEQLGQKNYPAQKLAGQARNFSLLQLEAICRRLLDLDLELKTGGGDDTTAIDTFIAALTA